MTAPMVEIKNIHKRFGKLEVLKGVDFEVQEGETVCLMEAPVPVSRHFFVASIYWSMRMMARFLCLARMYFTPRM